MKNDRRLFLAGIASLLAWGRQILSAQGTPKMYGLIGKMVAVPGSRDAFIDILLQGTGDMPGCLSYVVAKDPAEPDAIWITEVWTDKASHDQSLSLPGVQAAIAKGRPLIASFGQSTVTEPAGGYGLRR